MEQTIVLLLGFVLPGLALGLRYIFEHLKLVHIDHLTPAARGSDPLREMRKYSASSMREAVVWSSITYSAGVLASGKLAQPPISAAQMASDWYTKLPDSAKKALSTPVVQPSTFGVGFCLFLMQIIFYGAYVMMHRDQTAKLLSLQLDANKTANHDQEYAALKQAHKQLSVACCIFAGWPFAVSISAIGFLAK